MRLVWAVIPLVLIGIVGIHESFSDEQNNNFGLLWEKHIGLSEPDYFTFVSVDSKNRIVVGGITFNSLD